MPEISRRQFAVCLVAVVAVVLLGGRALRADAGTGIAGASPAGGFTAQAEPGTGTGGAGGGGGTARGVSGASGVAVAAPEDRVLVHVAGDVRRPGVYTLRGGARVADALERAGGGRRGADLDAINLAAKLTDGQQVLVGRRAVAGRSRGAATSAAAGGGGAATASTGGGASVGAGGGSAGGGGAAAPSGGAGGAPAPTVNVNQADVTALEALNGVGPAIAQKIVDYRTQNGPFKSVDDLANVSGIGPKKLEAMRAQVLT